LALILAGAGLHVGTITLEVREAVEKASRIYVDVYTMPQTVWLAEWARSLAGDRVVEASRDIIESQSTKIVEEASRGDVVVLVPGDPLVATTHVSLLAEASRRGVRWRVIPGISGVVASKTLAGLQYYRYGRTITVPGPWRGVRAVSIISQLYGNLCVGLHTLVLLDVADGGPQLDPARGASELLSLEEELASDMGFEQVLPGLMAVVVERAGHPDARVYWDSIVSIAEGRGGPWREPSSIVVPGIIHPTELDMITSLYSVSESSVNDHNGLVKRSRLRTCRVYEALSL
jgi:diphthine synthase